MKNKVNLWGTHGATILGISLVLFMLSLLITIEYHAYRTTRGAQERITVDVTLLIPNNIPENVCDSLALADSAIVANLPNVKHVEYISREEAFNEFFEGAKEEDIVPMDTNPMLPHLMVNFNANIIPDTSSASYKDFCIKVANLCNCPVSTDWAELPNKQGMVHQLLEIFYKLTWFLIFFVTLLLIITVVLINSLIRIAIYNRRDTITTMRLVGAKPSFIGRPFRLRSIAYGAIGGLIASVLNFIAIWAFSNGFHLNILSGEHLPWYGIISLIVILVGMVITYLSTAITIRIHIAKN
jgi:cell division transport system permease protein